MNDSCFSFRHAVHGKVVYVNSPERVRDAMMEGRVAELVNCTLEDLVRHLPEKQRAARYKELVRYAQQFFTPGPKNGNKAEVKRGRRDRSTQTSLNLHETPQYDPKLDTLRNEYYERAALVLASGPSLNLPNAEKGLAAIAELQKTDPNSAPIVVGVNRARAIFPTCDYLAVMDSRLYLENHAEHSGWRELFEGYEEKTFVNSSSGWPFEPAFIRVNPFGSHIGFSLDLREGFYRNFTTTLFAAQVAVWLGCKRIFFGGLDLKHGSKGDTHFFGKVRFNEKKDGDVGGRGLFSVMDRAFKRTAEVLQHEDVEAYNLNRSSAVRCFEFAPWKDLT